MSSKPFTIDAVSWHLGRPGNTETPEKIRLRFSCLCNFLHGNGLALVALPLSPDEVQDDFRIRSDDLTAEGLAVIKAGYDRWLGYVDRRHDPSNVSILEKALAKIRTG